MSPSRLPRCLWRSLQAALVLCACICISSGWRQHVAVAEEPAAAAEADENQTSQQQPKSYLQWMYEANGLMYTVVFLGLSLTGLALLMMNLLSSRRENICPENLVSDFEQLLVTALGNPGPSFLAARIDGKPATAVTERDPVQIRERFMRGLGVRRVPVVGARGQVSGVLSIDDVVDHIVGQLADVSGSIRNEQRFERILRS